MELINKVDRQLAAVHKFKNRLNAIRRESISIEEKRLDDALNSFLTMRIKELNRKKRELST
jgi:hypothetical protein